MRGRRRRGEEEFFWRARSIDIVVGKKKESRGEGNGFNIVGVVAEREVHGFLLQKNKGRRRGAGFTTSQVVSFGAERR